MENSEGDRFDSILIERGKYEEGKRERLWVKYYKNGKIKNIDLLNAKE